MSPRGGRTMVADRDPLGMGHLDPQRIPRARERPMCADREACVRPSGAVGGHLDCSLALRIGATAFGERLPERPVHLSEFLQGPIMKLHTTLLSLGVLASASFAGGSDVRINEVDADQTSTDDAEFIELFKAGGGSLDDHFVVLYNGNSTGDAEYATYDLDTQSIPADGFFVIGPSTGTVPNTDYSPSNFSDTNEVQNGADAVALWFDTTGTLADSDFFGTTPDAPPAGAVLVDAIVYGTSDSEDTTLVGNLTPGGTQIDENSNSNKDTESSSRVPDGGAAFDTTVWAQQLPTPGATNGGAVSPYTDLGCALAGVSGDPVHSGTGTLDGGTAGSLELTNAAPGAIAALLVSLANTPTPFKGGTLKTVPVVLNISLVTSGSGDISLPFTFPTGASGLQFYTQFGIQDAAAVKNIALSNALGALAP